MLRGWRGAFIKGATLKKKQKLLTLAKNLECTKLKYRYCPHGKTVGKVFRQMAKTWPYSQFYYSTLRGSPYSNALEKDKEQKLAVIAGRRRTFARGGATVVFEVRAVLALVVLRAGTVVVCGQVEAGRSVLTRVGRAVIDIQLGQKGIE